MSDEFTLEKLWTKLNEIQLVQVEKNVKLDEVLRLVQEHHKTLYGINGNPGISVIVDRLDQSGKERSKHFWVIYPALTLSLLKHAMSYFNGVK